MGNNVVYEDYKMIIKKGKIDIFLVNFDIKYSECMKWLFCEFR